MQRFVVLIPVLHQPASDPWSSVSSIAKWGAWTRRFRRFRRSHPALTASIISLVFVGTVALWGPTCLCHHFWMWVVFVPECQLVEAWLIEWEQAGLLLSLPSLQRFSHWGAKWDWSVLFVFLMFWFLSTPPAEIFSFHLPSLWVSIFPSPQTNLSTLLH